MHDQFVVQEMAFASGSVHIDRVRVLGVGVLVQGIDRLLGRRLAECAGGLQPVKPQPARQLAIPIEFRAVGGSESGRIIHRGTDLDGRLSQLLC